MSALWSAGENLLLQILVLFYNLTTSYGVAIILLTVLVRILLYPLSQKQMVSMQKMQKLQPRAKVLQEKYANDKETMNKEIMLLYKEHKVNPAAGCLPILVQLPILILLFNVLNNQEKLTTVLHLTKESFSFLGIHLHSSLYAVLGQALGIGSSPDVGIMAILSAMINALSTHERPKIGKENDDEALHYYAARLISKVRTLAAASSAEVSGAMPRTSPSSTRSPIPAMSYPTTGRPAVRASITATGCAS